MADGLVQTSSYRTNGAGQLVEHCVEGFGFTAGRLFEALSMLSHTNLMLRP